MMEKVYRTKGRDWRRRAVIKEWAECDGKTWDNLNESERDILLVDGSAVLVRLVSTCSP